MTPEAVREYLLRNYTAVDGLWFMKVEERFGFEAALDVDVQVWEVMAKIQSRQLRALLNVPLGSKALQQCFTAKMDVEGFLHEIEENQNGFFVRITGCPWHDKMLRANRGHLSAVVGNRICPAEYSVWAAEFGCSFQFADGGKICEGHSECLLRFND